ncbi:MAG TPA: AI-2E family transporter [Gemmatimonadales bacterium]|nr:AI-2E family transporter [Gemmatimonadales bacterium]
MATVPSPERPEAGRNANAVGPRGLTWRWVPPLAAALALGIGLLFAVRVLVRPIAILLLAITVGEALAPIVERLARRMHRNLAIALVYVVLGLGLGLIGWLTVPTLIAQAREVVSRLPELLAHVQALTVRLDRAMGTHIGEAAKAQLGNAGPSILVAPLKLASSLLELLAVMFLSIYWLVGTPALRRFALSLVPPGSRYPAAVVLAEMATAMGGYVRGAAINAVIMGTLAYVGLLAIGVKYALVLGLLTALGEPVPYLGPIVAGIAVALTALLQSPAKALLAIALFTVLQQLEGHILTPNIMGRETHTSQALVIFALLAGATVGGLLGAIVAIPVAGALQVFVLRVLAPAIRRRTGAAAPGPKGHA